MVYILKRDIYYCKLGKKRKIIKTTSYNNATRFETKEEAQNLLDLCHAKLKDFEIISVEEPIVKKQTVKTTKTIKTKRIVFSKEQRIKIYNKNKGKCAICGEFVPFDEFTVDHIIPLAKGGTNDLKNLQCACKTCNSIKQDILPRDLMDKLTQIVLYQMQINYKNSFWKEMKKIHKKYIKYRVRKVTSLFHK